MPATDANCFDRDGRCFDGWPIAHPEELLETVQDQRDLDAILVKINPLYHPRELLGAIMCLAAAECRRGEVPVSNRLLKLLGANLAED